MKKVYALSTALAMMATTAGATEGTNITTGRNRVQAVGRARATIVSPASASFSAATKGVLSNGGTSQIKLSTKNTSSRLGEIYLSGPENSLVAVSVSEGKFSNRNQIAVWYNERGEGKVKIGRFEKASEQEATSSKSSAPYTILVSY